MMRTFEFKDSQTYHDFKYLCVKKNLKIGETIEALVKQFNEENKIEAT